MKLSRYTFILALLFSGIFYTQNQSTFGLKYFDENYQPISKSEFESRRSTRQFLNVQGDSIHHRMLSVREVHSVLENRSYLDSLLTVASSKTIDASKPLVIIFYPGKDFCNSSGIATRKERYRWFNQMEVGIRGIKTSNVLYIYKEDEGLFGRLDAYKTWIKDPEQIVETLFFKKHYPCSSFVVISEKGDYISYFGEFPKEYVWKAMKILKESF
jgi:hypothetical protein